MHYSKAHQNFSNELQNPEALTNPQNFLGPNYETVINFWWFIDNPTQEQCEEVNHRYYALDHADKVAASNAAYFAAWNAARDAARYFTPVAYHANVVTYATWELIGMHTLLNDGNALLFVPMFDFDNMKTITESPPRAFYLNEFPIRYSLNEAFQDLLIERQALQSPYIDFINAEYPPIRNQNTNNDRFYLQE